MSTSVEPLTVPEGFQVEYPERPARARKRPAATLDAGAEHEDLSPGLVEVLSKLDFAGSSSATSTTSAIEHAVESPTLSNAYIDRGQPIPDSYGLDRLVALVRDPEWVFTYWELNGVTLESVKKQRGAEFIDSCAWVMRLYRVDEDAAADFEIDPAAGGWYVHVGRPGRYVFEVALLSPEGEWVSLLVSKMLGAPYAGLSDRIDETWRLSPEEEAALSGVIQEVLDFNSTSSRGGSRGVSSLGASRLRSSFGSVVSSGRLGGSESARPFLQSSGAVGGISSGAVGVSSGAVAGSWQFPGASGRVPGSGGIPGSGGSGGFGWVVAPSGAQEPVLVRPQVFADGPNWNAQPNLPDHRSGKTHLSHFKVKLPRLLYKLQVPKQTWPPLLAKVALKKVS
ncbi:MAG TPA: DUF4912 domain-containing protein [Planctomycetota bacterium]|nr:DUF4912 domain-containing protein [Planctomycetota bacterium]